ncbi:MAG: hypothetical protein P0Y53_18535 [Candidatus Pseudobacter hemicellulosilyticus]|uniref:Uncharacterized protein n=1 Tax=Candidatus Pseudobacter hemicellulosilyticus TaxID=3121375 RepID=A0AAJ6BG77_9BACT|nr:MAG: hypothetical protein P0Y53_18535 [Pseudobacter sp.]
MQTSKKYIGLYWLLFFVFLGLFLFSIAVRWEYMTMIIPFFCTFFVLAMDII